MKKVYALLLIIVVLIGLNYTIFDFRGILNCSFKSYGKVHLVQNYNLKGTLSRAREIGYRVQQISLQKGADSGPQQGRMLYSDTSGNILNIDNITSTALNSGYDELHVDILSSDYQTEIEIYMPIAKDRTWSIDVNHLEGCFTPDWHLDKETRSVLEKLLIESDWINDASLKIHYAPLLNW